jgi:hypothetical protein
LGCLLGWAKDSDPNVDCVLHPKVEGMEVKSNEQLWNEILTREIVKAVKRRDFEFAFFLSQQFLP